MNSYENVAAHTAHHLYLKGVGLRLTGPWIPMTGRYQLQGYYNPDTGIFVPIENISYVKYLED